LKKTTSRDGRTTWRTTIPGPTHGATGVLERREALADGGFKGLPEELAKGVLDVEVRVPDGSPLAHALLHVLDEALHV
jgi:hypothetical protein